MRKHIFRISLIWMIILLAGLPDHVVFADGPNADREGGYRLNLWYCYYQYEYSLDMLLLERGGFKEKPDTPFIIQYGTEKITLEPKEFTRYVPQNGENVLMTTYEYDMLIPLDDQWPEGKEVRLLSVPAQEGYEICYPGQMVLKFGEGKYKSASQKEIEFRIPLKKIGETPSFDKMDITVDFLEAKGDPDYQYQFTGSPVIPTTEVYLNGCVKLTEGVDYEISFQDNSLPISEKGAWNNAKAIVKGIGYWTGQAVNYFPVVNAAEPGGASTTPSQAEVVEKPSTDSLPAVGSVIESGKIQYLVTKFAKKNGTVAVQKVSNGKKSITIPSTVRHGGYVFKVTKISDNAFRNCKKLAKITIGSNVKTIGKNAFAGARSLRSIVIQSKVLKKVGGGALKGIHKKAVIKVPSKKLSAYRKLLKNKGQKRTVKITR